MKGIKLGGGREGKGESKTERKGQRKKKNNNKKNLLCIVVPEIQAQNTCGKRRK